MWCALRLESRGRQFLALPVLLLLSAGTHNPNLAIAQTGRPDDVPRSFANVELLESFDPALGDSAAFAGEVSDEFSFSDEKCEIPKTDVRVPYRWIVYAGQSNRDLVVGLWNVVGHVDYAVGAQIFPFCGASCELRSPVVQGSTLEAEQLLQIRYLQIPPLQTGEYTVTLFVSAHNYLENCSTEVQHNLSLGVLAVPRGPQKPLTCLCSFQKTGTNLVRYFVETLSGAPTEKLLEPPLLARYFKNFVYLTPGWVRFQHGIQGDCLQAEKLIITMRDPLEVILRHSRDLYSTQGLTDTVAGLEELVRQYRAFPRKKLVVHFEDAMGSDAAKARRVLLDIADMLELDDAEAIVDTYEAHLKQHRDLSRRMYPFKLYNTTSASHHSSKASEWELRLAKDAIRQSSLLQEVLAEFYPHHALSVSRWTPGSDRGGVPVVDCSTKGPLAGWDAVIQPWVREGSTEGLPPLVVVMAGRLDETSRRIVERNVQRIKELHGDAGVVVAAGGVTAETEAVTVEALQGLRGRGAGVLIYREGRCGAMEQGGFAAAVHAGVRAATVVMMHANMWVERRFPELRCGFVPLWHFSAHFFNKPLFDDPEASTDHTHSWVVEQADKLGLDMDGVFRAGGTVDECGVFGGAYAVSAASLEAMHLRGLFQLAIPSKLHAMMMERVLALAMRALGCSPCEHSVEGDIREVWDAMPGFAHELAPHRHLAKYFGSRDLPARGFWSDPGGADPTSGGSNTAQATEVKATLDQDAFLQSGETQDLEEDAGELCFSQECCDGQSMLACKMQTLDLDNARLPKGRRTAVVISGLLKECVTPRMVFPSIMAHVVAPLRLVDIFVHTSPLGNLSEAETLDLVHEGLQGANVRRVVVEPVEGFRLGLRKMFPQFARIREAFDLVLEEERHRHERYRHVVRLSPDSVWFTDWPPLDEIVPPGTAAGPSWESVGLKLDVMWVAARERAWELFNLLPTLFGQPVDREVAFHVVGCPEAGPALAEWCELCFFHEELVCPEGYLAYFLYAGDQQGALLRDSCALGGFVTHQTHDSFYQGCDPPLPESTAEAARSFMRNECGVDLDVTVSRKQVLEQLRKA